MAEKAIDAFLSVQSALAGTRDLSTPLEPGACAQSLHHALWLSSTSPDGVIVAATCSPLPWLRRIPYARCQVDGSICRDCCASRHVRLTSSAGSVTDAGGVYDQPTARW